MKVAGSACQGMATPQRVSVRQATRGEADLELRTRAWCRGHFHAATLELPTSTELAGKIQSKEEKADISLPHDGSELGQAGSRQGWGWRGEGWV